MTTCPERPTAHQLSNLRRYATERAPERAEEIIAAGSVSAAAFEATITALIQGTSTSQPAVSAGPKATDRQVAYALRLVASGWYDSDMGQDGSSAPTAAELHDMTRSEISDLIDDLR